MFPESELKYMQKQFTENLWTWKHSLHLHSMQLPIEICCSTSNTLIIIENLWKHLTLIHIKASFFVVYTVIPGYFDEFVHEIMKWNISKIKHNSYEVLNLQVYLIILVLTHGNLWFWGGEVYKEKVIFITGMPFFLVLPPENEFLQTFWTINTHNNEEFTIKHYKKKLCEVCGWFFWDFCINIT